MDNDKSVIKADVLFKPHLNQLKVLQDDHKYRVVVSGRRFGKSSMAINYALAWIMTKPKQVVWLILPQFNQAKSVYFNDPDISAYFMPYVNAGLLKKNDTELSLYCYATNSQLVLKGSDNSRTLRGSGLDLILWDEVSMIKPEAFNIISPSLADSPNHKVLYLSSPNGFDHLHDLALRGDHQGLIEKAGKNIQPDPEWMTFKFTSYDNLSWREGTLERTAFVANLDREKLYYQSIGQSDWFDQEIMAEFRKRVGAVHRLFDRAIHLIPDMALPKEWARGRGWDWGSSHPTASLRIAKDNDDNWFVEVCYKQKDDYISSHAQHIKSQDVDFLMPDGSDPILGYGDPSGKQWITELNRLGFSIRAAKRAENTEKKTWIEMAIDKINEKMSPQIGHTVYLPNGQKRENAPSFFILNRPENMPLLDEIETLTYKETSQGLTKTELDDTTDKVGHYDLHAGLRYFAISQGSSIYYVSLEDTVTREQQLAAQVPRPAGLKDQDEQKRLEEIADQETIKAQNQIRQSGSWW